MHPIEIKGYVPGTIGRITALHAEYYHREWGFGKFFETKVGAEMCAFMDRFDQNQDGLWTACIQGRVEGGIVIDGIEAHTAGAHLRWYILSSRLHGKGIGNDLLERAVGFCRSKQYPKVYLWTFKGLDAARHLYEKQGFKLAVEHEGRQWGSLVTEQKFILENVR